MFSPSDNPSQSYSVHPSELLNYQRRNKEPLYMIKIYTIQGIKSSCVSVLVLSKSSDDNNSYHLFRAYRRAGIDELHKHTTHSVGITQTVCTFLLQIKGPSLRQRTELTTSNLNHDLDQIDVINISLWTFQGFSTVYHGAPGYHRIFTLLPWEILSFQGKLCDICLTPC